MLPTNTVDAASFWLLPPLPSLMLTYSYRYFSHTIRRAHARSSRAGRFLKKRLRQSPSRLDVVRPPPLLLLRLVPIPSPLHGSPLTCRTTAAWVCSGGVYFRQHTKRDTSPVVPAVRLLPRICHRSPATPSCRLAGLHSGAYGH